MSPAIFDSRRSNSVQDNERRKSGSGFLFLNNRFKRAATTKATNENATSTPPTPTFGPVKDGGYFKRSDSSRSIPSLAQTPEENAEAKRPMTAMPGREKPFLDNKEPANGEKETAPAPAEEKKDETKAPAAAPVTNGAEPAAAPAPAPEPAKALSTVEINTEDDRGESSSEDEDEDEDKNDAEGHHPQGAQLATRVAIVPARVPTPEAAKRVSYHEDSDLHVKVHETDGTLAVYSVRAAALATASRVFRDLLAKGDAPGVLELKSPADTAGGLDVLFSIAHFKFHELPTRPNVDELYDLALAADKYAATHLLVPFMKEWVVALNRHVLMAGARNDEDKTLVLSWVFGEARWFSRVLSKAAYKSRVGPDGTLLDSRGRPWRDQPISDEVIAMLAATRAEAVDRIIKAVSNPVHRLLNPSCYPGEEIRYCHAGTDDGTVEDCEQLLLGSAIMGLTKARLWPAPEPAKIKVSAVELARAYSEVRIRRYQAPGLRLRDSNAEGAPAEDVHAKCGFGHREALEKILNTPAKVGSGVVGQLITRAKKSGAFGEDLFADLKEYLQDDGVAVEGEDLKGDPVHYKQVRSKAERAVENKTPADDDDEEDDDDDSSSESDEE
ncbi:nuclear pore protein [Colletotrichum plurivorum]|uniref:Nuclear pore protein n=1 Tax=Colletotrichum plurivorum TaxID=2175906 RepID=A0A8H6KSF0_9PEZI|nr:nuclear pore protein [Colletotrichum plurivorum]